MVGKTGRKGGRLERDISRLCYSWGFSDCFIKYFIHENGAVQPMQTLLYTLHLTPKTLQASPPHPFTPPHPTHPTPLTLITKLTTTAANSPAHNTLGPNQS